MRKISDIPPLAAHGVAVAAAAILLSGAGLAVPNDPSQFYALDTCAVAAVAALFGRNPALTLLASLALMLAYFLLDGQGFAVSDPVDALGLVSLIFGNIVVANMVGIQRRAAAAASARSDENEKRRAFADSAARELSHRIGNDLAALAGIATMNARAADHGEARAALEALSHRIRTVGGIYGRLRFAADSTASVDMAPFIDSLCADLRNAYVDLRPIALSVEVESAVMLLDRAVLVGLILNELLANALKYAFPDDRSGTIWIRLSADAGAEGHRLLTVTDDGIGLDGSAPKGTGYGQKLIRAMASQIEGRYSLSSRDGFTRAELRFPSEPIDHPRPRR